MAERRMFAKTIIDSDAFLDMPLSTQALYFHLSMRSDDDGFLNNAQKLIRMIGASKNDFDLLLMKNFIIPFDTGICVIKHWRIHNYIRPDRYKPTVYQEEYNSLVVKDNKSYSISDEIPLMNVGIPIGNQMDTQVRLGKDSIDKDSIDNIYSLIITYLNSKADTNYRSTSSKTRGLIKARLNEGFKEEDFLKVIDKKVSEWKNSEMEKYLRPETLFGNKFESYLNQKEVVKDAGNNRVRSFGQNISKSENKFAGFKPKQNSYQLTDEERKRAEQELI